MPFKIFVLSAGVFGVSPRRFAITLLVARGLRYTFWGVLGILYGDEALAILQAVDRWCSERAVLLLLTLTAALGFLLVWVWRRRSRPASAA
jgi:membrane protein DedA with SNARE-associated domain